MKDIIYSANDIVKAAEKLLEWVPKCSKGSSGDTRQENLRNAIAKYKEVLEEFMREYSINYYDNTSETIKAHDLELDIQGKFYQFLNSDYKVIAIFPVSSIKNIIFKG